MKMTTLEKLPEEGQIAPDFNLPVTGLPVAGLKDGSESLQLSKLKGKKIVLFFYPKDDTSGCTIEAIDFTAALPQFEQAGVIVLGMSPDTIKKHVKFCDKHNLGIPLISDEEKVALTAYGVWVEKSMYGRKYMGVERSTFLIDENQKIIKSWRKVKVSGHVDEVLKEAQAVT